MQAELARWTAVMVDVDAQPDDAEALGVSAVPALRICASGGQQVAERDGYLPPGELVAWLKEHYDAATAAADDALLDAGPPSATAVVRLVKQFQQRNPALREAAIRRLLAYPNVARPAVLKAFREGSLAARLAAMEVLEQWKAPLAELDPWRPETFSEERLARLEQWAEQEIAGDQSPPKELSDEQLAAARRQIERMLVADEREADAIRQRLARVGAALLPEVYARLKAAASDQDRRRLVILRYRLVASDALVLRWPGGLERLADADPRQRQQAADELAKLAANDDQPLLLELFADTDPLVREISLRGLQHIGGKEANAALVKLLGDPEPNVRAAVLKQLEESPDAALVPAVVKYLKQEKDADLVVHGIRFLQAVHGTEATKCLMSLLKHESWQVRAEAAAGIGKLRERRGDAFVSFHTGPASRGTGDADAETQLQAEAYVALLDLLEDPEGFVVAKAVEGLAQADMAVAVEPLVNAAVQHPDLAASVLEILARGSSMRAKAIPHLRKFCKHEKPQVRAAAIGALSEAAPDAVDEELLAALGDQESEVRIAAASAIFKLLDRLREEANNRRSNAGMGVAGGAVITSVFDLPGALLSSAVRLFSSGGSAAPQPAGDAKAPPQADAGEREGEGEAKAKEGMSWRDQWLTDCYSGRHRPAWTSQMAQPLEKMLAAAAGKERIAAVLALVPLGKAAAALPVLSDAVRANPELIETAHAVLPWLVWEQRLKAFQDLSAVANRAARSRLIEALSEAPEPRAAETIWKLLAEPGVTADEANALQSALMMTYLGRRYYNSSEVSAADRRELTAAAKPRTAAGSDSQRMVALMLLAIVAPDEAAEIAARLAGDSALSASLRKDAFQVQLITESSKDALKTSLAALKETDADRRKLAIKYLVLGPDDLRNMQSGFYFNGNITYSSNVRTSGASIVPKPPDGIKVEDVRPLLQDSDPQVAACANYLLVLLGEPEGMEPLLKYWREHQKGSDEWTKLVYRAIAMTDNPQYIPILREIYGKLHEYETAEFYWTIRIMSGPEILKFRKQVRDEVGPSRLQ